MSKKQDKTGYPTHVAMGDLLYGWYAKFMGDFEPLRAVLRVTYNEKANHYYPPFSFDRFDNILLGYYGNNKEVRAIDLLTGLDFDFTKKAHIKPKVEKGINSNLLVCIYRKGNSNRGYRHIPLRTLGYHISKSLDLYYLNVNSIKANGVRIHFPNPYEDPKIKSLLTRMSPYFNYVGTFTPTQRFRDAFPRPYQEGKSNKSNKPNMSKDHEKKPEEKPEWFTSKPPEGFIIDPLTWKFISRNTLRNKNTLLVGPSGCGKTDVIRESAKALKRPTFYFNFGSTQDPRISLIGSTQLDTKKGTFFNESSFVKALQTENAVVILDELSRANPEAWNILMPVLDPKLRSLKLDEDPNAPEVKVHPTVTIMATANTGVAYTSARVMDRALLDRFSVIEMHPLMKNDLLKLLQMKAPGIKIKHQQIIAGICSDICSEAKRDDGNLTEYVSTRTVLELAELIEDGFNLLEASTLEIYPLFEDSGDTSSERTYVRQIVQKHAGNALEEDPLVRNVDPNDINIDMSDTGNGRSTVDDSIEDILHDYLAKDSKGNLNDPHSPYKTGITSQPQYDKDSMNKIVEDMMKRTKF